MLGLNPAADPQRTRPAVADQRAARHATQGQTHALLYRARLCRARKEPVPFSSPWRTITLLIAVDDGSVRRCSSR